MLAQKPKAVLFDFGGTLIENGPPDTLGALEALRLAAKNPEVTTADKLYALWKALHKKLDESVTGVRNVGVEISLTATLRNILDAAGLVYDISLTECGIILDTAHFPQRRAAKNIAVLLEKLKEQDIRSAVISNTTMNAAEMGAAVERFLPNNDFAWIMTSADYIFMKPDAAMFEIAAKRLGVQPEDCLYCGDSFANDVEGPMAVGMTGLLYQIRAAAPIEQKQLNGKPYLVINDWLELANIL
ncbi:MAG: HAD family hydrolase [Oscillospiraceae bacterium]|nr:HAD family hydrolase [Oscillospiraceae bacterium]